MAGGDSAPDGSLRRLLLGVLLLGMLGTWAELYLLEHNEDWLQLIPLYLLGVGVAVAAWCMVRPGPASLGVLRPLMLLFIVAGAVGTYNHYTGNAEFEIEMYPSRAGFELFWESLRGAFPVLAPGAMSMFGLMGLVFGFRHPLRGRYPRID